MSAQPTTAPREIVPFWNRLREVTLYPAHASSMATIVLLALAKLVVFIPMGLIAVILSLMVTVAMYKYAFECLRATANGYPSPPEIGMSVDSSLGWKQVRLIVIFVVVAGIGLALLGPKLGTVLLIFLGASLPGATMTLAMEESLLSALNPAKWFEIFARIGWPYLAVVLLCLVISMSQGYGAALAARFLPLGFAVVAVALISNYGLVVMFHLMGYLIYQYHDEIGFEPDAPQVAKLMAKPDPDQEILDEAMAMVRDGKPEDATNLLRIRLRSAGGTPAVHAQYRKLLNLSGDKTELIHHGREYLSILLAQEKDRPALDLLRECQAIDPAFAPAESEQVTRLAQKAAKWGQPQVALRLLSGFHKRFPKSKDIAQNYLLAATLFHERMNQDEQACTLLRFLKATYPSDPLMPEIDTKLTEIQRMMSAAKPASKPAPPLKPG